MALLYQATSQLKIAAIAPRTYRVQFVRMYLAPTFIYASRLSVRLSACTCATDPGEEKEKRKPVEHSSHIYAYHKLPRVKSKMYFRGKTLLQQYHSCVLWD